MCCSLHFHIFPWFLHLKCESAWQEVLLLSLSICVFEGNRWSSLSHQHLWILRGWKQTASQAVGSLHTHTHTHRHADGWMDEWMDVWKHEMHFISFFLSDRSSAHLNLFSDNVHLSDEQWRSLSIARQRMTPIEKPMVQSVNFRHKNLCVAVLYMSHWWACPTMLSYLMLSFICVLVASQPLDKMPLQIYTVMFPWFLGLCQSVARAWYN